MWFSQYLKEGCISLVSKIPLKQDTTKMLRLLLRRVFSLDPVSYYIEANMWSSLCYYGIVFVISECFMQYFMRNWPKCKSLCRPSALKRLEEWIVAAAADLWSLCWETRQRCFIMILFFVVLHITLPPQPNKCS